MTTSANGHSDAEVQAAVVDELSWTPDVEPAGIGVSVHDGIVTLSGEVDPSERAAATRAALRVRGVSTVVDQLEVRAPTAGAITDAEVGTAVNNALLYTADVPHATVQAEVRNHVVTLRGTVNWNYERDAAYRAVERIAGVYFVDNRIALTPRPTAHDTEEKIRRALIRNAIVDADSITVQVRGSEVTLTGTVRSWAEKRQAGFTAWASPTVSSVHNQISVRPF
ncbi:BON domain-containing protein [Lacisediminihabitans profunda]|uniref:BON domain-containing protein n=1 Tax=Lacisediminihabitans profunda TaxID=2594790 RepID=A0A5C8UJF3_9MICO|nr:BON domain-containing protein [Lacisediminihabitans profunda]TXN28308.1 BON domain-containing protein [Lacisediminihabitans profunda]